MAYDDEEMKKAREEVEELLQHTHHLRSSETRRTLVEFVEAVRDSIGMEKVDTAWKLDVKNFFEVDQRDLISIKTEYPLYQQTQACYAINKFIEKHTKVVKIVSYSGEEHCAPDYQEMEVARGKTVPLLIKAWVFIEWKKTRLVVYIMFVGNYVEFSVFGLKKHDKIIHDFSTEVTRWMKEHNFLRGERLEFRTHGRLGFLDYDKNFGWDSVIIPEELKDDVVLNIIFPIKNEKLCKKHSIPWRRGVLLAGVAGTGKTQLARVLCNVLEGVTIIWATPKALYDAEKVQLLFEAARYFSPTLLIIEDIDFIGKSRDYITDPIVGELLTQLDGNAPNHGLFTLATTNRAELLDKALLERPSRFDVKLIFELPDNEHRLKMVKHFSVGKHFKDVVYNDIVTMTTGFTGAYIKEVIMYATLLSLKEDKTSIEKRHLERAIKQIKEKVKQNVMVR